MEQTDWRVHTTFNPAAKLTQEKTYSYPRRHAYQETIRRPLQGSTLIIGKTVGCMDGCVVRPTFVGCVDTRRLIVPSLAYQNVTIIHQPLSYSIMCTKFTDSYLYFTDKYYKQIKSNILRRNIQISIPWAAVRLSWLEKYISTPSYFWRTILAGKVGHTDLVFGLQSGFVSRSVGWFWGWVYVYNNVCS